MRKMRLVMFVACILLSLGIAAFCIESCAGKHVTGPSTFRITIKTWTPTTMTLCECLGNDFDFSIFGEDKDEYGEPLLCYAVLTYTWTIDGEYAATGTSYTFTPTAAEEYKVRCTVSDPTDDGDDPQTHPYKEWTVTAVEVASIDGPTVSCVNEECTYTATTNPSGHEDKIVWFVNGNQEGTGGIFHKTYTTPGYYTVKAQCGTCQNCNSYVEWTVIVAKVNIDTDSDNNGTIEHAVDDPIEETAPGRIVALNDGDSNNNDQKDQLVPIVIEASPAASGCHIKLVGDTGRIAIWSGADKTGPISLNTELSIPESPTTYYVEGLHLGAASLTLQYVAPDHSPVCSDMVVFTIIGGIITADDCGGSEVGKLLLLANPAGDSPEDKYYALTQPTGIGITYTWDIVIGGTVAQINGEATHYFVNVQAKTEGDLTLRLTYHLSGVSYSWRFDTSVQKPVHVEGDMDCGDCYGQICQISPPRFAVYRKIDYHVFDIPSGSVPRAYCDESWSEGWPLRQEDGETLCDGIATDTIWLDEPIMCLGNNSTLYTGTQGIKVSGWPEDGWFWGLWTVSIIDRSDGPYIEHSGCNQ